MLVVYNLLYVRPHATSLLALRGIKCFQRCVNTFDWGFTSLVLWIHWALLNVCSASKTRTPYYLLFHVHRAKVSARDWLKLLVSLTGEKFRFRSSLGNPPAHCKNWVRKNNYRSAGPTCNSYTKKYFEFISNDCSDDVIFSNSTTEQSVIYVKQSFCRFTSPYTYTRFMGASFVTSFPCKLFTIL